MRKCNGFYNNFANGKWERLFFEKGFFHAWGINYEEFGNGAGNYSVAIVELPNGEIIMPCATDIKFLEPLN